MTKKRVVKRNSDNSVSEPLAIVALILNILIIPGLGSLVAGRVSAGIGQLVLFFGGFIVGLILTITIIGAIIGIPLLILAPLSAWIWGIFTGIDLIKNSKK